MSKRLTDAEIAATVQNGKGRMPSFPSVQEAQLASLLEYVRTGKGEGGGANMAPVAAVNRAEIAGGRLYDKNCAICHGEDLAGAPSNYPGLIGAADNCAAESVANCIAASLTLA